MSAQGERWRWQQEEPNDVPVRLWTIRDLYRAGSTSHGVPRGQRPYVADTVEQDQGFPAMQVKIKNPAARLRRLCLRLEREGAQDYELLRPSVWPPLHVHAGRGEPRLLLYSTKEALVQRWVMDEIYPAGWMALSRYGLPTPEYLDEIRLHLAKHRLPLLFVGDLDPLDLTIFAILRHGEATLTGRSAKLPVYYAGIDDGWLALCERNIRKHALNEAFLTIGALEREHLSITRELLPDIENMIGPRCLALLESGKKIEIEGACNIGFYGEEFPALLVRRLKAIQRTALQQFSRTHRPD